METLLRREREKIEAEPMLTTFFGRDRKHQLVKGRITNDVVAEKKHHPREGR